MFIIESGISLIVGVDFRRRTGTNQTKEHILLAICPKGMPSLVDFIIRLMWD